MLPNKGIVCVHPYARLLMQTFLKHTSEEHLMAWKKVNDMISIEKKSEYKLCIAWYQFYQYVKYTCIGKREENTTKC